MRCISSVSASIHDRGTAVCSPAASIFRVSASSRKGSSMFIAVDLPEPFTPRSSSRPPAKCRISSSYWYTLRMPARKGRHRALVVDVTPPLPRSGRTLPEATTAPARPTSPARGAGVPEKPAQVDGHARQRLVAQSLVEPGRVDALHGPRITTPPSRTARPPKSYAGGSQLPHQVTGGRPFRRSTPAGLQLQGRS